MVKRLLDFLNASPVNFLAAKNIASYLEQGWPYHVDMVRPSANHCRTCDSPW